MIAVSTALSVGAKGALLIRAWGTALGEFESNDNEALKARFKAKSRAFSASLVGPLESWDVVPGW